MDSGKTGGFCCPGIRAACEGCRKKDEAVVQPRKFRERARGSGGVKPRDTHLTRHPPQRHHAFGVRFADEVRSPEQIAAKRGKSVEEIIG